VLPIYIEFSLGDIGPLIGFAGVILTLIVNAWLGRRQHDREVDHERRVLRNALVSEITRIHSAIDDRMDSLDPTHPEQGPLLIYEEIDTESLCAVYRSHLAKIGLLTPPEAQQVVNMYARVQSLPSTANLLWRTAESKEGPTGRYVPLTDPAVAKVRATYGLAANASENALSAVRAALLEQRDC